MLRLMTFGGLSLTRTGGPLQSAPQRRQLALLALLAAAGERGLSREKLFAYLWPESATGRARHTLNQNVYSLRRTLDADVVETAGADSRLNTRAIGADVIDFEAALRSNDVAKAAALYSGSFLDGFFLDEAPEFERWVESERARLAKLADAAVESLARDAGARGDHSSAATWWMRLAERDPLNSRVALATMEALALSGDRAGALRQGERHTELLREELEAAADATVLALMSRLRESSAEPRSMPTVPSTGAWTLRGEVSAAGQRYLDLLSRVFVDRYQLRGQIESGGVSTAFRATALSDGAPVIVRVIQPPLAALLNVRQFLSGLRRVAVLSHPQVGRLLEAGESNGVVFYVTEPIDGDTLRARIEADRQLALRDTLDIAADLATGLAAAHTAGILHLDLKPRNVLLRRGRAVVTEIGIAPALAAAAGETMTRSGVTLGTPAYMSPEQAAGERKLDARSDIYSLGCIIYHMLAGEPPFAGPTMQAILIRRLTESVPSLSASRGQVPGALERVLSAMLARVPADRAQTMADVEITLRQLRDEIAAPGVVEQGVRL